jgi:hypothetical protein
MSQLRIVFWVWGFIRSHGLLLTKVAAVGTLVLGAYAWVHGQGHEKGYEKAEKHYLHQIHLREELNKKAIARADRVYAQQIQELSLKNKELENALADFDRESSAAPGALEPGLDADSVRRLNRIR